MITEPLVGEQRTIQMVSGNVAWNMNGTTVVPAPADAEQRQLEIWLTPHGCLKAALEPGANPIVITRNEQGKGPDQGRLVHGAREVPGAVRDQRQEPGRADPDVSSPIPSSATCITNWSSPTTRTSAGVMFPTTFHAHHDLDDDLEGEGVNVSGGHNSFGLTVSNVQLNVAGAAPTVPDAARTATIPPVRVESTKVADGFWYVGGGTHSSMAVEFRDFVTVIEAPLNEDRSLAVIAEVKKLIPNKPIRYLVSTHHHWDHCGGVRAYVAQEGVTIVLQQANHSYYAEVLTVKPWTLKPDRLSLAPAGGSRRRLHVREGGPEVRADGRHEGHGDLQRPGPRARPGHADRVSPEGEDRRRSGPVHAACAERAAPDEVTPSQQNLLQQRAAAEAGRHDDRTHPRRTHVPVGGFREVRQQRQDTVIPGRLLKWPARTK